MGEHTRAPWLISEVKTVDGEFMVVGGEGHAYGLIAQVTTEEDAQLIAAAPAMLAALKEYIWGRPLALATGASRIEARRFRLDQVARAAIAKALNPLPNPVEGGD